MQINFLVETVIGLVILLGVLFLFLFVGRQKKLEYISDEKVSKNDLQTLLKSVKNKNTQAEELQKVVYIILEDFAIIQEENFNIYAQILLKVASHPNTNKDIILALDRGLCLKNPSYKKEISNFTSQGLNSRKA